MAITKTIVNRFDKKCANCALKVLAGEGFACCDESMWSTYCKKCVPIQQKSVKCEITGEGKVYFPYDPNTVAVVKTMPGAKWQKEENCWKVNVDENSIVRVVEICSKLNMNIAPAIIDLFEATKNKTMQKVETILFGKDLFPYQVDGVAFLTHKDKCFLADEMGLGKTVQALCSLPANTGTIIVCPASLKYNWQRECVKWRNDLKPIIVSKRDEFRNPNAGEVIIVNYDILPEDGVGGEKYILVCDEVHLTKNYKTLRHKAVKALANNASKIIGMSGTPMLNKPFDLFGVLSALHMEKEVFGSWQNFLKLFGAFKNRWGGFEFGTPSNLVPEMLKRVMLRRKRDEVLPDLPKKTITDIVVNGIPEDLLKQMNAFYPNWSSFMDDEEIPDFEEFSEIRRKLALSRVPALVEMIESHEEEGIPLVVFSVHREPIEFLAKREGWGKIIGNISNIQKDKAVQDFQNGHLKGLAATIGAGGTGLTLTRAWKAIFLDLDWTPGSNIQAEDRICRLGQTRPCEIIRLSSNHPLDQHVSKLLSKKIELHSKAIDECMTISPINFEQGENEEAYLSRMQEAANNKAVTSKMPLSPLDKQKNAMNRVNKILENEREKSKGRFVEPKEIDTKLEYQIRQGLKKMLEVCDGAIDEDNQGFNKPDAYLSRHLCDAGLDNKEVLLTAYYMLSRYPRQMKNIFGV
jgi:SWI/SNF-related matrix-associated actin-dependent regulator 1 of chromatin subfamily A